ncbi:MAG: tRNA 2-thiouridine(34) synthase MnmA [Bacteroidota bacterium]
MKRVVVGLSGGVDSSVAAYLLQKEGYEVIGMFMRNWHDESVTLSDDCPWIDDSNDALLVAQHLGIPFQVIDLSEEYKERIVNYMFQEYEQGRTPNPDVLCNREIKFDVFLNAALQLGADFVATGHYCRKRINPAGSSSLLSGLDKNKDQSYFLCQVSQDQLAKALFPVGDLEKSEVRRIAAEQGLLTAEKKDSQGLCFVGKISLPEFLQQQLKSRIGNVIEIPADLSQLSEYHAIERKTENIEKLVQPFVFNSNQGQKVATHQGAHFYTIGQRKGLQIGGRPLPSFAVQIDVENNIVYSCQGDDHPALNRWALKIEQNVINWIQLPHWALKQEFEVEVDARIRYRQPLQKAKLIKKNDQFYMLFNKLQRGITPGQFAAWYIGEELIGSGVIES